MWCVWFPWSVPIGYVLYKQMAIIITINVCNKNGRKLCWLFLCKTVLATPIHSQWTWMSQLMYGRTSIQNSHSTFLKQTPTAGNQTFPAQRFHTKNFQSNPTDFLALPPSSSFFLSFHKQFPLTVEEAVTAGRSLNMSMTTFLILSQESLPTQDCHMFMFVR